MEVELISEESFTVSANGKSISGMRVVSKWEGLKKLTDSQGRTLIVTSDKGPFSVMFEGIFGYQPKAAIVIMASPDLVKMLSPDVPPS